MKIRLPDQSEIDVGRIVVKLGTKQVTDLFTVNSQNLENIIKNIVELKKNGIEVIITASGAIGLGIYQLYRNRDIVSKLSVSQKQAIAGLGQVYLMDLFQKEFSKYNIQVGQVLLTYYIFENRSAYLNARNTLNSMLEMDIVPVINENDSVAVEEIKVGDNDRLGAFVTLLVDADLYIMLSDIDGFYQNYNTERQEFIRIVGNVNQVANHAGKQEENYTKGGMVTKLQAAKTTTISGVPAIIANGFKEDILLKIFNNLSEGTIFLPTSKNLNYKKRWITGKKPKGIIYIDNGAVKAVLNHKSLLPSGIVKITGNFKPGDTVSINNIDDMDIAIGLSNYSSDQIRLIAGKKTFEVETILGEDSTYSSVVHIDNMALY